MRRTTVPQPQMPGRHAQRGPTHLYRSGWSDRLKTATVSGCFALAASKPRREPGPGSTRHIARPANACALIERDTMAFVASCARARDRVPSDRRQKSLVSGKWPKAERVLASSGVSRDWRGSPQPGCGLSEPNGSIRHRASGRLPHRRHFARLSKTVRRRWDMSSARAKLQPSHRSSAIRHICAVVSLLGIRSTCEGPGDRLSTIGRPVLADRAPDLADLGRAIRMIRNAIDLQEIDPPCRHT